MLGLSSCSLAKKNSELLFFSSIQPENPDEKSSPVSANYHMNFPFDFVPRPTTPVHGLICLKHTRISKSRKPRKEVVPVLCNPSTEQFIPLPKVKTRRFGLSCYLGYDPVENQYKVLSMTYGRSNVFGEHQVLTVGTRQPSWRMIQCCIPHHSSNHGICIDGVLYYKAAVDDTSLDSMVVCFHLRSEKFSFIRAEPYGTLINYNGKLASLKSGRSNYVDRTSRTIELLVLEDMGKQEWSEHTYTLPSLWENIVGDAFLKFVGVTRTNEIVLSKDYQSVTFYVFYYNAERNTIVRVKSKECVRLGLMTFTLS